MPRLERFAALLLPTLLACDPAVGSLTVRIDTDVLPEEVAFQDGDGPWRVVQLVNGTAELPVTDPSGRYGIAMSNRYGPNYARRSTIWQQSSHIVRSTESPDSDWPAPVEVQRHLSLSGLKPGASYSVRFGGTEPYAFVAPAPAQQLTMSSTADFEGPLVVIERDNQQARAFVFPGFHEGDPVTLEGGVDFMTVSLFVKGLEASDRAVVHTSCSFASPSGLTWVFFDDDFRAESGKATGAWLPSAPGTCERQLEVTKTNVTWTHTLAAGDSRELSDLTIHVDRPSGSASWTPGTIDDDSRVFLGLGSLFFTVEPGWRRGASSVHLGDTSAAPLLAASTRKGHGASLFASAREWSLSWRDDALE